MCIRDRIRAVGLNKEAIRRYVSYCAGQTASIFECNRSGIGNIVPQLYTLFGQLATAGKAVHHAALRQRTYVSNSCQEISMRFPVMNNSR